MSMEWWKASTQSAAGLGLAAIPRIAVVGAGVTGLAAAHRLVELTAARRRRVDLIVVEAQDRVGGTISTEQADGYLIEGGADSFITEKPWAAALCGRLGLADRLLAPVAPMRRTFVAADGRLIPLPDGFLLLAPSRWLPFWGSPLLSWWGKLRAMGDLVLPPRRAAADESIADLVRRRLGRDVLTHLVQPLVSAIYTVDPAGVSAEATVPRFRRFEREQGSLVRGLRRSAARRRAPADSGPRWSLFAAPQSGMRELIAALADRLPASSLKLRRRATSLTPSWGPRAWRLNLADGTTLLVDAVVIAVPAPRAARLLTALDPELARMIGAIPYHSSAVVTLAYPREAIGHSLDGLGFVVPERERHATLACSFSSLKYPGRAPEGAVLLRAFVAGPRAAQALERDDEALIHIVQQEVGRRLRISGPAPLTRVHKHVAAMPQYEVGHVERAAAIRAAAARHRGVVLCGNGFDGLGVSDCVHSGETAAEAALASIAPPGPDVQAAPG